jgi:hypothetical protein
MTDMVASNGMSVIAYWQQRAESAESALAASQAEAEELESALRNLKAEVHGAIGIAEEEIGQAIGTTNLRCLENRLLEAHAVLKRWEGK